MYEIMKCTVRETRGGIANIFLNKYHVFLSTERTADFDSLFCINNLTSCKFAFEYHLSFIALVWSLSREYEAALLQYSCCRFEGDVDE